MNDELRVKFEAWCLHRGINTEKRSNGHYLSDEVCFWWKLWSDAHASRDAEVEANERAIPDDWELFCCRCFASESSGSWDHVVVGSFCANCCGNGTAFPLPKMAIESIRNQASWVGKRYYPHKEDAEVEALRKDAERYRWLRSQMFVHRNTAIPDRYGLDDFLLSEGIVEPDDHKYINQAIDAAMREDGK